MSKASVPAKNWKLIWDKLQAKRKIVKFQMLLHWLYMTKKWVIKTSDSMNKE